MAKHVYIFKQDTDVNRYSRYPHDVFPELSDMLMSCYLTGLKEDKMMTG